MSTYQTSDDKPAAGNTRLAIYTDGSSLGNLGPSGWGFVAVSLNNDGDVVDKCERSAASRYITTNNRAELAAAIAALTFAAENHPNASVTIISDSRYLVTGFTEWLPRWVERGWQKPKGKVVENRDLWERLVKAAEGLDVTWEWVEAHMGDALNARADALARTAAQRASPRGFAAGVAA